MTLRLRLDAKTPADVVVEHFEGCAVFTPKTVAGARWLTTHEGWFYTARIGYVTSSSADLEQRLRDAGLVVGS